MTAERETSTKAMNGRDGIPVSRRSIAMLEGLRKLYYKPDGSVLVEALAGVGHGDSGR